MAYGPDLLRCLIGIWTDYSSVKADERCQLADDNEIFQELNVSSTFNDVLFMFLNRSKPHQVTSDWIQWMRVTKIIEDFDFTCSSLVSSFKMYTLHWMLLINIIYDQCFSTICLVNIIGNEARGIRWMDRRFNCTLHVIRFIVNICTCVDKSKLQAEQILRWGLETKNTI